MTSHAFESDVSWTARAGIDAPQAYEGVRTRRVMAFLMDYAIVLGISAPFALVILLLGVVTLGLAWGLYAFLLPAVALPYVAFTMGGRRQATPGMRLAGLRVARLDGRAVDAGVSALHAILFWLSFTLLTPFVVLFALISPRKQLLHDLVLGTVVVRRRT